MPDHPDQEEPPFPDVPVAADGPPPWGEELDDLLERALGLAPGASRRGPTYDPPPTPLPHARPRRRERGARRRAGSGRTLAGLGLVAVLAAGYVALSLGGGAGSDATAAGATARPTRPGAPAARDRDGGTGGAALIERLPAALATRCRPAPGLDPVSIDSVVCNPEGTPARVELRAFDSVDAVRARYRAIVGGERGGRGASRCARGAEEERAWAAPDAPDRPAGRYACTVVDGGASLWWTSEAALVMGRAAGGGDLAGLFDWWRVAPEALVAPTPG